MLFPWEQRLGRVGAKAIESYLSYFSTTSAEEVDLGIDFHCVLIEKDQPSINFMVQAKGTEYFKKGWSKGIKKSTILYWLFQRSPVFLIVFDEKSKNCYWMSIEDQRISLFQKLGEKKSETISIKFDRLNKLERGKAKNFEFIEKIKDDWQSVQQFWGSPQFKGNGYVKTIPPPPRSKWELMQTKETVRKSLYSIVQHHINTKDMQSALLCCRFLGEFDKSHYNHFEWLGIIYRQMGEKFYGKSIESFKEALIIIEGDLKLPPNIKKRMVERIQQELAITKALQSGPITG